MPDEWFYKLKEAEIGPIAWEELKWLADHGKLDRNALVRQGRTGRFLLAKRVKGLINLTAAPPVSPGTPAAPSPPPKAPPQPSRSHSPTLSFTPAKKTDAIALPPTMQPVAKPDKKAKPEPDKPVPPKSKTTPPVPVTPPAKSKPPLSIDDLLPPPALPKHPPRK